MRKTIEFNSKGEAVTVEHADVKNDLKQHGCNYNLLIIENLRIKDYHSNVSEVIDVLIDCECEESQPKPFIKFFDTPVLPALDSFRSWFCQVAPWFIQNGYKIIDKRKEKSINEN